MGKMIFAMVAGAIVFAFVVTYLQARYVYHDMRCMWADCRIIK